MLPCSQSRVTEQIIGWLLINSLHRLLLLHPFFFSSLSKMQKPRHVYVFWCVCVCVLLATMPVIQGVLVGGGFKRRGGRAGLPVFVPAATNAGRKPGNEVRLCLCQDLSLLFTLPPSQSPSSMPPSLSARFAHSHPRPPIPRSAQGCCCLLA